MSLTKSRKKIFKAAALEYNPKYSAPILKGYGEEEIAQKIFDFAQSRGIGLVRTEAEEIWEYIKKIKIDTQIPTEIYLAVARIYAYLGTKGNNEKNRSL